MSDQLSFRRVHRLTPRPSPFERRLRAGRMRRRTGAEEPGAAGKGSDAGDAGNNVTAGWQTPGSGKPRSPKR